MHLSFRFFCLTSGIFVSYCIYGIFQEKIFKSQYGDGDKFTYALSLIFIQTVVIYAYTCIVGAKDRSEADKTPFLYYFCCALTYILAMAASFSALQWVSFPAQVIAKSGKPIPVMIMGVLIGNKVFPIRKYFIVTLIVFGVALFLYKDGKASAETSWFGVGEMLLASSLAMDGLTNSIQERIMSNYSPTSNNMMGSINKVSSLFLGTAVLATGEVFTFTFFVHKYPAVMWEIALLCITSTIGQHFIYKMICEFDTLSCSIVTTTRKFFTVLGSVIIFGHTLLPRQWFAVFCVFSGLILDAKFGKSPKRTKVVAS